MLYNILIILGAWLMLGFIVALFVGHHLYKLNPDETLLEDEDDDGDD